MQVFLLQLLTNEAIRKELNDAKDFDAMLKIAQAHGFELNAEDFTPSKMNELSTNEMQAVAGGVMNAVPKYCICNN